MTIPSSKWLLVLAFIPSLVFAQQSDSEGRAQEQEEARRQQEAELKAGKQGREERLREAQKARDQARLEAQKAREEARRAAEEGRKAAEEARKAALQRRDAIRQAHEQMRMAERRMRDVAREQRKTGLYPRIGLVAKSDSAARTAGGVVVERVRSGAAADKAGIQAGDVLLALNGQRLMESADAGLEETAQSVAKLVTLLHMAKPGEKVTLDYRRGSEARRAELILEQGVGWPNFGEAMRGASIFHTSGRWLDVELVGMNPDLGQYFGTDHGLLVVRSSTAPDLKLKGGDVILKIGDQKAESPIQAVRVLRSYQAGKTIPVEILRHKQVQKLTVQVPDRDRE
jgi:C-terminal processing protease CtpA/Prc